MARQYDFNDSVNLRGLGPVDVMMEDFTPGGHQCLIMDMWKETKEGEGGKTTYRFNVVDTEPGSASAGAMAQIVIGTDWTKDFNVGHLINLFMALGAKPEKLTGVVPNITPAVFKGKTAFMFQQAAPEGGVDEEGRRVRGNRNFITKEMYEAAKKMQAAGRPVGATATAPQRPSTAATAGAPPNPANGQAATGSGPVNPTTPPPPQGGAAAELGGLFGP